MNELKIFENPEFESITIVDRADGFNFIGTQIAKNLGYSNPPKAIRDHVDDDDKLTERIVLSGQNREVILVNESGLYSLILSSKLPSARRFKHWVTHEVLPAIRKTGAYGQPMSQAEMLLQSAQLMVEHEKKLLAIETKQSQQDKQIEIINSRLDMFNGVEEANSRESLRHKLNAYCYKNGIAQSTAWNVLKQAFNDAYNTNIMLLMTLYRQRNDIKKLTFPDYLEKTGRLADAHAVLDKMLNKQGD